LKPPTSILARCALWPLSLVYRGLAGAHRTAYLGGWLARDRVAVPVVSVGNLTVGGTGKTPLVARICSILEDEGLRTAVVSRGYKRRGDQDVTVVSRGDGSGPRVDVSTAGDEPYLLAATLPRSAVVVAPRRADGARLAAEELHAEVIVIDDGYQHHRLARNLDLLVMDATCPVDSGWVLPAGALREPVHAACRAGALILSGCHRVPETTAAEALFRRHNAAAPLFHAATGALEWMAQDGAGRRLSELAGGPVAAFCGIGQPERFRQDLLQAGLQVPLFVPFPDHHWYTDEDLKALSRRARKAGVTQWITTEKDFVRLSREQARSYPIGRLRISVEVREEPQFRSLLMNAVQHEAST
jgi:tetraacyldisaccharide 4'-kinase